MTIHYDKPLSLRLQWILKEMKEKSHRIIDEILPTSNHQLFNLTDHFHDYPTDDEFDYSDYGYEDFTEQSSPMISSTTIASQIDDPMNTISYYDDGEQDVYTDDEWNETINRDIDHQSFSTHRIPSYHQRQPIIWNIRIDKEIFNRSSPLSSWRCSYLFVFILVLFIG